MSRRGLIVYPYLPHYREGVFVELDQREEYAFSYITGPEAIKGIKSMPLEKLKDVSAVQNVYFRGFLWQRGSLSEFRRVDPDFVIVLSDPHNISATAIIILARLRGIPVFYWTHGWTRVTRGLRALAKRAYFSLASSLLLYGNVALSFASQSGVKNIRAHVIYNSIAVVDGPSVRGDGLSALGGEIEAFAVSHQYIIGAVARLQKNKSLGLIIDAAARLRNDNSDFRSLGVVFVGEGPERRSLEAHAARLGVPLLMPGASYDSSDLKAFYDHAKVTIMPEKVGLSGIQSMSYGVPVLSNSDPVGQMPEWEAIRPGCTGEVFSKGDASSLASAILRVLSGPSLANECRDEYEERWSPKANANAIVSFLDSYFAE